MQPFARPLPASISPRLLKRSSLPSSRLLCWPLSGAASLPVPAVLERLLPATPAVGPLSSCRRTALLRVKCVDAVAVVLRLTPAQTVPINHSNSSASASSWISPHNDLAVSLKLEVSGAKFTRWIQRFSSLVAPSGWERFFIQLNNFFMFY